MLDLLRLFFCTTTPIHTKHAVGMMRWDILATYIASEIVFCHRNLRPYAEIIYALQRFCLYASRSRASNLRALQKSVGLNPAISTGAVAGRLCALVGRSWPDLRSRNLTFAYHLPAGSVSGEGGR